MARLIVLVILLGGALHGAFDVAHAEVPTAGDVAACNQEARERVQAPAASPTSKDEFAADAARRAGGEATAVHGVSAVTQSTDPQIHGMDGAGAKDAAYRAVYRVCMRRKGF
jgi:hypothetical protein